MAAFAWIRARVPFDNGTLITSDPGDPTWMDAHSSDIDDLRGMMESHARVLHLDDLARTMLANPLRVHRVDVDAPELAGDRMAPLREHLARFGGQSVLGVAVPIAHGQRLSVLAIGRSSLERRFASADVAWLEALAPHVVEASVINRQGWLRRPARLDDGDLVAALMSAEGRLTQTTPAFVRLLWPDAPPGTAYLPEPARRAVRAGQPWRLADGEHVLAARAHATGEWFLRIRRVSPVDRLSAREREIAALFAAGHSHKAIATEVGLAPATVRNHLQKVYDKLEVTNRDDLRALLDAAE